MKKIILPVSFTEQFKRFSMSSVCYSIFLLLLLTSTSTLFASGWTEKKEKGKNNLLVPGNQTKRTDKLVFQSPPPCDPFASITPLGSLVFCDSSPLELQACNQYTFSNTLSGQEVVTPVNTTASGTVTGVFNSVNNVLELSVSFQGFQTLTTVAHLHIASPGTNGLIIEDLAPEFPAGSTSGQFTKAITLSASEATALLGGNMYIDIHSQNAPAGEIRAQLTPALDCPGFSFLWNTGETSSSIFVNASGTYEVFVINSIGCADSAEVTVTADPAALVDAGPDQTICATDTIYLNATLSGLATNMVWQKNAAFGVFIDPDTDPQTRFVLNATGQALSSIRFGAMTNDPGGNVCQGGLDTVEIFINPAAIANAGSDITLCQTSNSIFPLNGSISGIATTATWSGGSGTFQPDANTLNAVYVPSAAELAAADDLILTLTTDDPAGLCAAGTDEMLFRIDSAAIVDAGPDQNICVGDTIYLNATLSGVATNMVWQKNAVFGDFIDPDTNPQTRFVLNATGQALSSIRFGVMTNDPGGNVCQGGLDTVEIFINQPISLVSIQKSDFNGYSISCNGADDGSATAIISGGVGPFTYLWSNGEQTETISSLSPGTYTVTVSGSCEGELSASVYIDEPPALTIMAEPISNFNGFNVSCFKGSDGEARAVATGGTGPISYLWSNSVANDTVTGLSAGLHTVTVTDLNGCAEMATVTLTEPSLLQVEAGSNRTIYRGYPDSSCTTIQAVVTGGLAPYTILWSNGSTSPTITSCALQSKTLYVTVTDANNCLHTDSVRICVIDVRCGSGRDKVRMCHSTNSPTNPFRTICTSISAARWHLNNHSGDLLGRCGINHDCDWPQSSRYDDAIAGDELEESEKLMLGAVPNPFSVQTTIRFSTGEDDFVKVWVSDITGRNIQTLYEGESESDILYEAIFDGSPFNEGMYFIRMSTASGKYMVSKMMLIK